MSKFDQMFHLNPHSEEDARLLGVLDNLVRKHGGKVHALRWMLRQAGHPTFSIDDESVQKIVDAIVELRGVIVADVFEQERDARVIVSKSLANKWG